ncbi:alpha/beta hydrolase [Hoeflea poritis]|uniref:Alpha/beta fold hydrolase n=1 Tax=Hoeflea poritis TaxID=2993659 RepID=A0ABT4VHH4_9HYPH|nr:alpha/beta fold hydrolase [Hoeflea poritis]MDA4844153.1 alpha/beta fold hydrolase [Hoeflea poritis]
MDRRRFLKVAAAGSAMAAASGMVAAKAQAGSKTAFVFVHGSWHGGWCWGQVEPILNDAGHMTVAIDLPGHGLNARLPGTFGARPLDAAAFATDPSPLAGIGIADYAAAVVVGAERARAAGAEKVIAVGHSMGGVPITFAAAGSPQLFDGLVYVAALAPVPGKPAGAYLQLEDQAKNSKLGPALVADPAVIGALRIDTRSTDPKYLALLKEALAADVDDGLLATVMHLLTPDAPVSIYGEAAEFSDGFADIKRTYIRCTQDQTVVPSTGAAIVADMNAAWPSQETNLIDIESSHEVMFAKPAELANMLAGLA